MALAAALTLAALAWRDVLRPGSFRRARLRDVQAVGAPLWLAAGLAVYASWVMGMALAASLPALTGPVGAGPPTVRAQAVAGLGGTLLGVPMALAMCRLLASRAGPPQTTGRAQGLAPAWRDLPLGLACLALAWPLVALAGLAAATATEIWTARPIDPIAHQTLATLRAGEGGVWRWALLVAPILGAPVVEEVVFRTCLQGALRSATGRGWLSVLLASVLFAWIHAGVAAPHALVPLLVLGIALGVAYERTRSLGVPIVMHIGFNAANVAIALSG